MKLAFLPSLLLLTASAVAAQEDPTAAASSQEPAAETPLPFRHLGDQAITVNFQDEDLARVLEMFSTNYKLNLVYGPDVVGSVTMNLFDVPVAAALEKILATNGYQYEVDGNFIVVEPMPKVATAGANRSPYPPTPIYLNHLRAQDVAPMIAPMLAGGEKVVEGFKSQKGIDNVTDAGGNELADREILILYASEQTLKRVRTLLDEIDRKPPQVLVEATILSVNLSSAYQMGVDFTAFGGIDFQALGANGDISSGVDAGDLSTDTNPITGWLGSISQRGFTDPSSDGLHFGILRNQVGVFVQALEDVGNATVLSNPQILTLNRHAAQLLVGRKLPYFTTTTTETGTQQSVNFLEVGTSLVFRPFVTEDGYVRMEIHPKKSDGFINNQGLPEETTSEVTTNIMVQEGNTVVIGGLMEEIQNSSVSQIPLLGSLPWIGGLFRRTNDSSTRAEIIILLTPHIVGQDELSDHAEEMQRRLDAARASLAASHYGYLRPSYARRMYAEAARALAQGDPETALAKAEWGLRAMPADPDLARLAEHCREEIEYASLEALELQATIEMIQEDS